MTNFPDISNFHRFIQSEFFNLCSQFVLTKIFHLITLVTLANYFIIHVLQIYFQCNRARNPDRFSTPIWTRRSNAIIHISRSYVLWNRRFQGPGIARVLVPSLFTSLIVCQPACARCNRFRGQRMPCLRLFFVEEYSVGGTAAGQQGAQGRRWSIADNFYSVERVDRIQFSCP